jgi:hypothetical protein
MFCDLFLAAPETFFSKTDLQAMSCYGLLTIPNSITGTTFLHEAINKCYTLEVVDKVLFNLDILDRDGYPPLYIHFRNTRYMNNAILWGETRKKINKAYYGFGQRLNNYWEKIWKKQYELTL